jgi:glycerol-3-phosphate dehydrogenase subunit C
MADYAIQGLPIVGTSTSCTLTLKEDAPELLDMHDERAHSLTMGTWDIFEWLRDLHEQGQLKTDFRPMNMLLPYHPPCQYRAHRVGKPSMEVMQLIPGLEVRDSEAPCCGIAGTYGYKVEKYQIAMDVGEQLFSFVRTQGNSVTMTACDSETCRWQLEHGTNLPSRHPIEILAAAYGLYDMETRKLVNE